MVVLEPYRYSSGGVRAIQTDTAVVVLEPYRQTDTPVVVLEPYRQTDTAVVVLEPYRYSRVVLEPYRYSSGGVRAIQIQQWWC